jgi:hypothetical protein
MSTLLAPAFSNHCIDTSEFTDSSSDTPINLFSPAGSEPRVPMYKSYLSLSITQKEKGKLAAIFSNSS